MSAEQAKMGVVSQLPVVSESAAIISIIERAARDPSVDIDKMERLIALSRQAAQDRARTAFDAALAEMQPELPVVGRKGKIEFREKDGQGKRTGDIQQSTPYALWEDINEAIRPVLQEHGFALSFRTGLAPDGKITVTGILSHREGHREETTIALQHDSSGSKNAVQAVGSSTSYGKRYTAIALLNITTRGEDDDGKAAGDQGTISDEQAATISRLLMETKSNLDNFLKWVNAPSVPDMKVGRYDEAVKFLNLKKSKAGVAT